MTTLTLPPSLEVRNNAAVEAAGLAEIRRLAQQYGGALALTPSDVCRLNAVLVAANEGRTAADVRGESPLRTLPAHIRGSDHVPPAAEQVPALLAELCNYANSAANRGGFHVAAFLAWRLTWLHPFDDANGRTSRALAYLTVCCPFGDLLPGSPSAAWIMRGYKGGRLERAQAVADAAWREGRLDLDLMEGIVAASVATQLMLAHAKGGL